MSLKHPSSTLTCIWKEKNMKWEVTRKLPSCLSLCGKVLLLGYGGLAKKLTNFTRTTTVGNMEKKKNYSNWEENNIGFSRHWFFLVLLSTLPESYGFLKGKMSIVLLYWPFCSVFFRGGGGPVNVSVCYHLRAVNVPHN